MTASGDRDTHGSPEDDVSALLRGFQRLGLVGSHPGKFWRKSMDAPFFYGVFLLAAVLFVVLVVAWIGGAL